MKIFEDNNNTINNIINTNNDTVYDISLKNNKNENNYIKLYQNYIKNYIKIDGLYGKNNLFKLKKKKDLVDLSGLMMYTMISIDENPDIEKADKIAEYILNYDFNKFYEFINNI